MEYKTAKIIGTYGGPVFVTPTDAKPYIACLVGGGIDPVAKKIAELTGGQTVDLMKKGITAKQMACVVTDCGGTARCAMYPQLGVKTINTIAVSNKGNLMGKAMTPDMYVSGVKPENITLVQS